MCLREMRAQKVTEGTVGKKNYLKVHDDLCPFKAN